MNKEQIKWRSTPKTSRKPYQAKMIYDVLITTNKSGKHKGVNRTAVRVGLINRAGIAFNEYEYIAFSDICPGENRIYFMGYDEKVDGVFKLSPNRNEQISMCFQFTPTEAELAVVAKDWENKAFPIKFDDECQLYYINKADGVHKAKKMR